MSEIKYVSKVTIKNLGCEPTKQLAAVPADQKSVAIARIYGLASDVKRTIDKNTGEVNFALVGDFEGENLANGDRVRSGICWLPKGAHQMVESKAKGLMDESETFRFALQIEAVRAPREDDANGYTYHATSLLEPEGSDPLDELRKKFRSNMTPKTETPAAPAAAAPAPVKVAEPVKATVVKK